MNIKTILISFFFYLLINPIFAQNVPLIPPENNGQVRHINQNRSAIKSIHPTGYVDPSVSQKRWDIRLQQLGVSHASEIPKNKKDSLKRVKTQLKVEDDRVYNDVEQGSRNAPINPIVNLDFKGNDFTGSTPPDNHIAVSNGGRVVSVCNSSILFADENGNNIYQESFSNFLSVLNHSGSYFDPRVIYDPVEDRFIFVVLNGNAPSNSNIIIAFSSTNNPNDTWWLYTFDGDPSNSNAWFDFPSIGMSTAELYVSGNLFDNSNNFTKNLIYQIDKSPGYTGGSIDWLYWDDVQDANGFTDFNIVPISYGFDGSIEPGIFFLSSDSYYGDEVMLYWTTGTIGDSPTIVANAVSTTSYEASGNGLQAGSNNVMSTNDTRLQSGFYANDFIHYVMNTDRGGGYTGIYYGRLEVSSLTSTRGTFGLEGYDYAYPSICPFTTSLTDKSVLISFLRTGSSIYPEFRVVNCDDDMEWSSSVQVRGGDSYVDFLSSSTERWGDYSGIARRHLASGVEVWVAGCYGENYEAGYYNMLGTWVGKIGANSIISVPPVANFTANQTTITVGQSVTFFDQSSNNPTSWSWNFSGGSPSSSSSQNPTVSYNSAGVYTVSMTASNNGGNDSETKNSYIVVNNAPPAPPVANFTANQTTITVGQSVTFFDQSSNNPTSWSWSFSGGSPSSSSSQNPTVSYNSAGVYTVSMTASNSGGNDSETKNSYIVVNNTPLLPPIANFTADQTTITIGQSINFSDVSTNSPNSWSWSFPGGAPTFSNVSNPEVTYNTAGVYNVTLTAYNDNGDDSETKNAYIVVNEVPLTINEKEKLGSFKVFPNPVYKETINVSFELEKQTELNFYIVDVSGKIVKQLLYHRVKAGENLLSFNGQMLAAGTYSIVIQDKAKNIIRNEKIIIIN